MLFRTDSNATRRPAWWQGPAAYVMWPRAAAFRCSGAYRGQFNPFPPLKRFSPSPAGLQDQQAHGGMTHKSRRLSPVRRCVTQADWGKVVLQECGDGLCDGKHQQVRGGGGGKGSCT